MLVLAISILLIKAKKKAAENTKIGKISDDIENGKNSDYLETNLI